METQPSPSQNPLHSYESDPHGPGSERLRRVLELKAAIDAGQYDIDGQLRRFLRNIAPEAQAEDGH